jgi:LPXTG-motif cell wall-anchored protein
VALADADAGDFCAFGALKSDETDEDGMVEFLNLDLGLYYVNEGTPGDNPIVRGMDPFYVAIPMPVSAATSPYWNYDVEVHPKNQLGEIPAKTVDTDGLVIGSDVVWTIADSTVPVLNEDDEFDQAAFYDTLDPRLAYKYSVVKIGGVVVFNDDPGLVTDPLDPAYDASLVPVAGVVTRSVVSGQTRWTFTDPAGLAWLTANGQGDAIEVAITTTVLAAIGDGAILNEHYGVQFNNTDIPGETTPYTYVGQLTVVKQDDQHRPLEGAQFKVWAKDTAPGAVCPATAPTTDPVSTGTSGADGIVTWTPNVPDNGNPLGLFVAETDDGPLDVGAQVKDYCLYETVVPTGYTAGSISNPITIKPGTTNLTTVTVLNPQQKGPQLPLTGAGGTLLLTIGGLALVGVGVGTVVVSRNRRRHDAA